MEPEERIDVKVCTSANCIRQYFHKVRNRHSYDVTVFGVELEWNYRQLHKSVHPRLDVIDICTSTNHCIVIGQRDRHELSPLVRTFLEAPDIIKVGVGVAEQFDTLRQIHDVHVQSAVDIRHVVDEEGYDSHNINQLPWILGKHNVTYEPLETCVWKMNKKMVLGRATKLANFAELYIALTLKRLREMEGYRDWEIQRKDLLPDRTMRYWRKYFNQPFDYAASRFTTRQRIDLMMALGNTSSEPPEEDEQVEEALDNDGDDDYFRY